MSSLPLVLAHRGACRQARENTLEAFRVARALGADGVELDVRRTADGVLVVHHDAVVDGFGRLVDRLFEDVRSELPFVPTLEEALAALEGSVVNVEIKNSPGDPDFDREHRVAEALVELLRRRGTRDRVVVSSFNLDSLDHLRRRDPSIDTGWLALVGFDPLDALAVVAARGYRALHPDVRSVVGRAARVVAERAHELELAVRVWTVDDEDEMRALADAGVDALITNVPDVALRVLGR